MRFVRPSSGRSGSEPWFGVLIPDTSGVSQQARFIFQKLPFSEDLRDYTFPSFEKVRVSKRYVCRKVTVLRKDTPPSMVRSPRDRYTLSNQAHSPRPSPFGTGHVVKGTLSAPVSLLGDVACHDSATFGGAPHRALLCRSEAKRTFLSHNLHDV